MSVALFSAGMPLAGSIRLQASPPLILLYNPKLVAAKIMFGFKGLIARRKKRAPTNAPLRPPPTPSSS